MEPIKITASNGYAIRIQTITRPNGSRVMLNVLGPGSGNRARLYLCEQQVHDLMKWLGAAQAELDLVAMEEAKAA